MDIARLTPPRTGRGLSDETFILVHNDRQKRPYQAYCVTEASSRPSTPPDSFHPQPSRTQRSLSTQGRKFEPSPSQDDLFPQPPATNIEHDGSPATSPSKEKRCNEQQESPNRKTSSRDTVVTSVNHITRAVTPRGSHPLVGSQTPTYDQVLSQFRVQPLAPSYATTSRAYQRKSLPSAASDWRMDSHPLPPLPNEICLDAEGDRSKRELCGAAKLKEDSLSTLETIPEFSQSNHTDLSDSLIAAPEDGKENAHIPPEKEVAAERQPRFLKRSVASPDDIRSSSLRVPGEEEFFLISNKGSQQCDTDDGDAQFPSSIDVYGARVALEDLSAKHHANRRTQPKDAKLKYQFGRRPSIQLKIPSLTLLHRHTPDSPTRYQSYDAASQKITTEHFNPPPSPSARSYTDIQAGPRPPPWATYETLELQRRNRSELRERKETRKYRMTLDTSSSDSLYKGGSSTFSLRESPMRQEVEEYREQVLRLYPDLEFDGSAGKGGRCCWGCVVM
jgi:hypothetical protein